MASLVAQTVKRLPTKLDTWVQSLGWEDLLEKEMATHSSILAWKIPWMEEPGWRQSMGSQRVGHKGFPGSSAGKESACNAGDPGTIAGLGRSAGEGIVYPLQYSWASLVAQTVKKKSICQCRLTNYNNCTSLVGEVDNVEECAWQGAESIGQLSVPSPQFCCKLKTALQCI